MMKNDAVRRSRGWAVALAVALAILHPACGGDNNGNGSETFTDSETLSVLEPFGLVFTAQRNGVVEVDVNWNDSDNDIDVFVTRGTCANFDILLDGGCNVIASSDSTAKPERLNFNITSGTIYTVWAWNIGPGTDTVTIRLVAR